MIEALKQPKWKAFLVDSSTWRGLALSLGLLTTRVVLLYLTLFSLIHNKTSRVQLKVPNKTLLSQVASVPSRLNAQLSLQRPHLFRLPIIRLKSLYRFKVFASLPKRRAEVLSLMLERVCSWYALIISFNNARPSTIKPLLKLRRRNEFMIIANKLG